MYRHDCNSFLSLIIFLQALAAELAPNTRVNCIAPGFVPTNFASFITHNDATVSNFLGQVGVNFCAPKHMLTFLDD